MKDKNKKAMIFIILLMMLVLVVGLITICYIAFINEESTKNVANKELVNVIENENTPKPKNKLTWELTLANTDNKIPEDYKFELENIDSSRQFDSRAIEYLREMMQDIRRAGITNIWVQSAYRSIESQTRIYNREMQKHMSQGKTEEEARKLTEEVIMIPGCSDHNLGLAVDFNDAETTFEDTRAFTWLKQNAENYGFVMRYPKDKEHITKITYEPWHWRYVGKDNAIEMNRLNMCLEEYIELLNK